MRIEPYRAAAPFTGEARPTAPTSATHATSCTTTAYCVTKCPDVDGAFLIRSEHRS